MLKGFLYYCRLVYNSSRLLFILVLILTVGPSNWNSGRLFIGSIMTAFIVNLYLLLLPSVYAPSYTQILLHSLPVSIQELVKSRYIFHSLIALFLSFFLFIPLLAAERYQLFPLPAKLHGLVLPTATGFGCGLLLTNLLLLPFIIKLKRDIPPLLIALFAPLLFILLPVIVLPLMLLIRYPYGWLWALVIITIALPISYYYSLKKTIKYRGE